MSIVRVAAGASRAEFESASCERVLHAALRAGFDLPHECATGTCGTCRATITAGNATALWPEAPGTAKLFINEKQSGPDEQLLIMLGK